MKHTLLFLLTLITFQMSFSQVFDVENIKNSGDMDNRINIVIMGDGYQTTEFAKFETDANNFVTDMFSQSPFAEYSNYFNVYIINIPSNESGASHPGTAADEGSYNVPISSVDNYFGTNYYSYHVDRIAYNEYVAVVMNVMAEIFLLDDQEYVRVKAPQYSSSGSMFLIASPGETSNENAIHAIGEPLINLKDEYWPPYIL